MPNPFNPVDLPNPQGPRRHVAYQGFQLPPSIALLAQVQALKSPPHPPVPSSLHDEKEHRRKLAEMANRLLHGALNIVLDVSLVPNATQTVITDSRIGYFSAVIPAAAMSARAAAAIAAGIWIGPISKGSATVNHGSDPNTDRVIRFVIVG